jgi:hypothetical protein
VNIVICCPIYSQLHTLQKKPKVCKMLEPYVEDGIQSLGSVGAVRLLHWKQKGWIRLVGEQNKGLLAVAELQSPETTCDFHSPCVFAYAQLPPTAPVGAAVTIRMVVYLRLAIFGLTANEATRNLMAAVEHHNCHGGVIPTRAMPQSTNKYTRSNYLSAGEGADSGGVGAVTLADNNGEGTAGHQLRELPHSRSVYAQFTKKKRDQFRGTSSSSSSSSSSASSSTPSSSTPPSSSSSSSEPLKSNRQVEVIDLISDDDDSDGETAVNTSVTLSVKNNDPKNEASAGISSEAMDFSTRSLLCAAENTGYLVSSASTFYQPAGLASGLVLRDYQVSNSVRLAVYRIMRSVRVCICTIIILVAN